MSVFAVGPALAIDGPLPVPPPYRLLSVPGVLKGNSENGRWVNGVNVYPYPPDPPSTWEPCSTGTFRTKDEGSDFDSPRFDSFVIYQPLTCSGLSLGDWDEFKERAETALDARQSYGVELALSQGVALSTNPFLGDANVTILGGGAVTPAVGLSWLERAIGQTAQQGLIHAPPEVTSAWGFDKLETGEALYTVNGTPVASGGGYIGATASGGAAPASGQSYAFATGPVEVRLSEVNIEEDLNGTLDTSNNDVTFRAEKVALATWDTALQVAVLIDWTP